MSLRKQRESTSKRHISHTLKQATVEQSRRWRLRGNCHGQGWPFGQNTRWHELRRYGILGGWSYDRCANTISSLEFSTSAGKGGISNDDFDLRRQFCQWHNGYSVCKTVGQAISLMSTHIWLIEMTSLRSGLTVLTTASPKNFDLVKSRGADEVFDYNDPECAAKIRSHTKNSLRYVLDCISTESSFKICAAALSSDSSKELDCVALLPLETWPREDVNARPVLAYTSFGEEFSKFGATFPPLEDHYNLSVKFWALHAKLMAEGKIKPHPVTVREGGLQGVPKG